jgi:hypothetical protein
MSAAREEPYSVRISVETPLNSMGLKRIWSLADSMARKMKPEQQHPFVDDAARQKRAAGPYTIFLASATHVALCEGVPAYLSLKRAADGFPLIEAFCEDSEGLVQVTVSHQAAIFGTIPSLTGHPSAAEVLQFLKEFSMQPCNFIDSQSPTARQLELQSSRFVIVPLPSEFRHSTVNAPTSLLPRQQLQPHRIIDLTTADSLPATLQTFTAPPSPTSPVNTPYPRIDFPAMGIGGSTAVLPAGLEVQPLPGNYMVILSPMVHPPLTWIDPPSLVDHMMIMISYS